jgi:hypothetical protein
MSEHASTGAALLERITRETARFATLQVFGSVVTGAATLILARLLDPRAFASTHPRIGELLASPQTNIHEEPLTGPVDNKFSARSYRVIHFVVDMPVRVPAKVLSAAPASAASLGHVVFVLVEFQLVDHDTELANEAGEASHARYKERQRIAVRDRLQLGSDRVKRTRSR